MRSCLLFLPYVFLFSYSQFPGVKAVKIKWCLGGIDLRELDLFTLTNSDGQITNYKVEKTYHDIKCDPHLRFFINITRNQTTKSVIIASDGPLILQQTEEIYYFRSEEQYCVERIAESVVTLKVCQINCKEEKSSCLRKCCGRDKILAYKNNTFAEKKLLECQYKKNDMKYEWKPHLNNDTESEETEADDTFPSNNYVFGTFNSNKSYQIFVNPHEGSSQSNHKNNYYVTTSKFHVVNNDVIAICQKMLWRRIEMGNASFCVDEIEKMTDSFALLVESSSEYFLQDLTGISKETSIALNQFQIIYYTFVPVSITFLTLVIIVHALLWEAQNIHGIIVVSYVATLLLDYVTFIFIPLEDLLEYERTNLFAHEANVFFSYSTMCWLTVINFDIWIKFRKLKFSTSKSCKRLFFYFLFSWSVPLVFVLINHFRRNRDLFCPEVTSPILPPMLNHFIESQLMLFIFNATMLAINSLFFVSTICQMFRQTRKNSTALKNSSHKKNSLLEVGLKFFVVMGGCWLLDSVPMMILTYVYWTREPHYALNIQTDLVHFLNKAIYCEWVSEAVSVIEAVAIFYIFICKQTIYKQLWEKYSSLRRVLSVFSLMGCCMEPSQDLNDDAERNTNSTNCKSSVKRTLPKKMSLENC